MSKSKTKGKRPLQVLFLPVDDGGCGWYRIRQLDEEFHFRDDVQSHLMDGKEDSKMQMELIQSADVIVGRLGDYQYYKLIKEEIDPHKPMVFDHDDNTMEVLPTSEHYREFGTEDAYAVINGNAKPVWVTGLTEGFNRYKNLAGQMNLLYILGSADLITAPVENLLAYYMQFTGKNCKGGVIHNSLNFAMYPDGEFKPADKKEGEIRIGWQGGVSHLGDWQEIAEPLNKVMMEYPEVTLYVQGSYYKNQFKGFEDRVIRAPWFPFKGYTFKLKTVGLDGAVIPLESKTFNEYKSEVKFSEFSALGVPCVVKDMLPYSRVAKDNENAWTYKTPQEFEVKFRAMIEDLKGDRKVSKRLATRAYKWARRNRNIKEEARQAVELYKSILPEETRIELL